MNISQVKVIEFVHQISVGMLRIGIRNTFAGTAGRKSNARFLASNLIADSCQYLQDKSRTVFNAASVAVISFIGPVFNKLLNQVAVGPMYLNAVETRCYSVARGLPVVVNNPGDFIRFQGAWCNQLLHAIGGKYLSFGQIGRAHV